MQEEIKKEKIEVKEERQKSRFEKFSETHINLLKPIQTNCPHYNLVVGLNALYSRAKDFDLSEQWKKETQEKIDKFTKKANEELLDVNKKLDDWFFNFTKETLIYCKNEKVLASNKDPEDISIDLVDIIEYSKSAEFHNKCVELAKTIRKWVNITGIGMNHEVIFETITLFA